MGRHISEEKQSVKFNIDKKRSSHIEEDCFEKSYNYCNTGDSRTENLLKVLFLQKLSDVSFTNPTSTVGLQLLNLWLLKIMLRCKAALGIF
jgi:hypothetical protein